MFDRLILRFVLIVLTMALAAGGAAQSTITWVTHPVIYAATGEGELLARFTEQTGIAVEVVTFPTDALAERIPAEFISGSGAFDVLSIAESFWTELFATFTEPLDAYLERHPVPGGLADFSPGMVQQFRVPQTSDGTIYGLPQRMSVDILFYRKDLFEEYGIAVPNTLDEYYETAVALKEAFVRDGRSMFPATFQGIQGGQGVLDWYDWASPLGADILEPPTWHAPAFNSPAGIKALEMRRRFVEEGLVSQGVLSYSFDDAINIMAQGHAAMTIMYAPYWARLEDSQASQIAGNVGYAPAPRDPAVDAAYFTRGWGMFISGASRNKDAAWEFVRFLTAPEQQLYMALNHGNPVSRFSVLESEEYLAAVPVAGVLAGALEYAKIQPNIPEISQIIDVLARHINAALGGSISAEGALEAAEREVRAILE